MDILTIVTIFLFILASFSFICGVFFRNKSLYRRFFIWWLNFNGVPKNMQEQVPVDMYVRQGFIASWLFTFLGIVIFSAAFYIMSLK